MPSVEEGLKEAFAGESQANRKYLAFAEKADKDGFPQVAKLFRAADAYKNWYDVPESEVLEIINKSKFYIKQNPDLLEWGIIIQEYKKKGINLFNFFF